MAAAALLASSSELERTLTLIRRFFFSWAAISSKTPWSRPSFPTRTVGLMPLALLMSSFLASFSVM